MLLISGASIYRLNIFISASAKPQVMWFVILSNMANGLPALFISVISCGGSGVVFKGGGFGVGVDKSPDLLSGWICVWVGVEGFGVCGWERSIAEISEVASSQLLQVVPPLGRGP